MNELFNLLSLLTLKGIVVLKEFMLDVVVSESEVMVMEKVVNRGAIAAR